MKILLRWCQFVSPILFPQDLKSNFQIVLKQGKTSYGYTGDPVVDQTLAQVLHVNVTVQGYTLCAGMAKAVEKRVVLAKCGTLDKQLQTLKSLRRNGALQAFKCFQ